MRSGQPLWSGLTLLLSAVLWAGPVDPALVDQSFSSTGNLTIPRVGHTATLLSNGKVLLAGGLSHGDYQTTAEVYDSATGIFSATGRLNYERNAHTATLLTNGKVLLAGGDEGFGPHKSAELYDPASGTFSATGSLASPRFSSTATRLPNGKVLIVGGDFSDDGNPFNAIAAVELYDPAAGTFSTVGNLSGARFSHSATLLADGRVLIAGGFGSGVLSSAQLYDPATGTISTTGSLLTKRYDHAAALLPNGKVLIAGGWTLDVATSTTGPLSSAELYDPASGTFSATGSLARVRSNPTATLLPDGSVLIAGGRDDGSNLSTAELYDPVSGTFKAAGSPAIARSSHTATLLSSGKVLLAGGRDNVRNILASAELYDPIVVPRRRATRH